MIAFVDTMILVWWVRGKATLGQESMLKRSRWLMQSLEDKNASVMLSTISEAEFLRGEEAHKREEQSSILHEYFSIKPFDTLSAHSLASIFSSSFTIEEYENRRTALKADLLIVSTAIANNADVLYTHDSGCRKLAEKGGLTARDLPTMPNDIFGFLENRDPDDPEE